MNCKIALYFITLLAAASPVLAWSEICTQSIISDALNLMPENFKIFIKHYEKQFWSAGALSDSQLMEDPVRNLADGAEYAASLIRRQENLGESVRKLGSIAYSVAKMCSPVKALKRNAAWNTDYSIYVEKNRSAFFIKWPGIDRRPKSRKELDSVLEKAFAKTLAASEAAKKCFETDGKPIAEYDRLSIPFGSGSMAYSNATATTGMIWLYAWDLAGGVKASK